METSKVNISTLPTDVVSRSTRDRVHVATPEALSFGDVLRNARTANGIRVHAPEAASPERMFDAEKPAAHTRRREEMKARSKDDIEQAAADRRDRRVGVSARREQSDANEVGRGLLRQDESGAVEDSAALEFRADMGGALVAGIEPSHRAILPTARHPSRGVAELGKEAEPLVTTDHPKPTDFAPPARATASMRSPDAPSNAHRATSSPVVPGNMTQSEPGSVARDMAQWLAARGATNAAVPSASSAATGFADSGGAKSSDSALPSSKPTHGAEPSSAGEPAEKPTSFADIVRSLRVGGGERFSSASIRLNPPELGRMFVSVRMADGQVRVAVRTETEAAMAVVKQGAAELRASLRSLGLEVDAFDVRHESSTADGAAERVASLVRRDSGLSFVSDKSRREPLNRGAAAEAEPRFDVGSSSHGISERHRRRRHGLDVSI